MMRKMVSHQACGPVGLSAVCSAIATQEERRFAHEARWL